MDNSGISYPEGVQFLPVYTRVQRWHKDLSERDQRIMEYALRNVMEETMGAKYGAAVIPLLGGSLLTMFPFKQRVVEAETRTHCDENAQALHSFYQDFIQMIFFVLQSKGLHANQVFSQNLLTDKPESILRSISSLQEWVGYVLDISISHIHSTEENISVVDKVKRLISDQLGHQDLSREDIASQVYLNPDYLTRIFKKETGMSLSDYLQVCRIEYAKELLANTEQSVSDIALAAGYSSPSYFSTIFKKATGRNPMDFRKQTQHI